MKPDPYLLLGETQFECTHDDPTDTWWVQATCEAWLVSSHTPMRVAYTVSKGVRAATIHQAVADASRAAIAAMTTRILAGRWADEYRWMYAGIAMADQPEEAA